jgi:hypothetical protein
MQFECVGAQYTIMTRRGGKVTQIGYNL